jgi:hypothetical protein
VIAESTWNKWETNNELHELDKSLRVARGVVGAQEGFLTFVKFVPKLFHAEPAVFERGLVRVARSGAGTAFISKGNAID